MNIGIFPATRHFKANRYPILPRGNLRDINLIKFYIQRFALVKLAGWLSYTSGDGHSDCIRSRQAAI